MKTWLKTNWIWVALSVFTLAGIIITPGDSVSMVPYAFTFLSLVFYGAIKLFGK